MKSYEKVLEDEKYNRQHGYLFTLMFFDFIFTYIGIQFYGVITEANPILVWTFNLPFPQALCLRLFYSGILVYLAHYLRKQKYKYHPQFVIFALTVNCLVMFLHFHWVFKVVANLAQL